MIPPPSPCTARPATKTAMSPASPAVSRPAAKAATPQGSATRGPRRSPRSPPTTMPTTCATRNALNGQAYQASPWSSATAVGIAVPTAMASKAMKVTSRTRPAVVSRCARSSSRALDSTTRSTLRSTASPRECFPRGDALDRLAPAGGDLLGGGGDDLEQGADDAEVGQLEDRRLGVLVDRDDGLRGLHAGPVLDGTGDADGDVELRGDGLAGLAHLEGVRVEAGVDRGPRGADGAAEGVGQTLDEREVLRAGHTAAAGDDDRGLGQLRPTALLLDDPVGHPGLLGRIGHGHLDRLLLRRGGGRLGRDR